MIRETIKHILLVGLKRRIQDELNKEKDKDNA